MIKSAVLSECGKFRFRLERIWDETKPLFFVQMLNPSDADHERNDPTILTLIRFGMSWGFGGFLAGNAYPIRSSTPDAIWKEAEPLGPNGVNDFHLRAMLEDPRVTTAVVAWGNNLPIEDENQHRLRILECGKLPMCMGITKGGRPKHPLARGKHRIPATQQLQEWKL